jgi:hypothetical protein
MPLDLEDESGVLQDDESETTATGHWQSAPRRRHTAISSQIAFRKAVAQHNSAGSGATGGSLHSTTNDTSFLSGANLKVSGLGVSVNDDKASFPDEKKVDKETLHKQCHDIHHEVGKNSISGKHLRRRGQGEAAQRGSSISIVGAKDESMNAEALRVVSRVRDKLIGRDFNSWEDEPLKVETQVDRLIKQATRHENLCQSYIGWCPLW